MTYKEFVLLYTTLIMGLSCANIFYGLGQIIHDWKDIKFDWACIMAPCILFVTIVDFWFHAFSFPYEEADGSIIVFVIFLLPPVIFFFNTLLLFPSSSNRCDDYTLFFQKNLRPNVLSYGLGISFTVVQLYTTQFMLSIFIPPLLGYVGICALIYITNSLKIYKILTAAGLLLNLARWGYEGIYN